MNDRFTHYFRKHYGRPGLHLPSCRLGILVTLLERYSEGDEIILSPVQSDSVLASLIVAGLRPVFVDVDARSGNLRPGEIARVLTERTKVRAILTTHLFGCPEDLDALEALAREHGIELLEDAVHGFAGSKCGSRLVGTVGEATFLSISKFLPGAKGGVLLSEDEEFLQAAARRAHELLYRPQGKDRILSPFKAMLRHALPGLSRWRQARRKQESGVVERSFRSRHHPDFSAMTDKRADVRSDALLDDYMSFHDRFYRHPLSGVARRKTLEALDQSESVFLAMKEGQERLVADCPLRFLDPGDARYDVRWFRVPFATNRRDALRDFLRSRGIAVNYYWDSALHEYCDNSQLFVDCTEGSPRPAQWCENLVPLDPLQADGIIAALQGSDFAREAAR
ncbi:MAG: DegT/DnrJ/EryC1/StrS family aminotransferase [Planctomycetes bacterium]|nr:DegT/DnrJ/EryC1/StrS family aminotransferase [Planctomycetota bacterium]